jgi:hypothetical protein
MKSNDFINTLLEKEVLKEPLREALLLYVLKAESCYPFLKKVQEKLSEIQVLSERFETQIRKYENSMLQKIECKKFKELNKEIEFLKNRTEDLEKFTFNSQQNCKRSVDLKDQMIVGLNVYAMFRDGFWHRGTIWKTRGDRHLVADDDDGVSEWVEKEYILKRRK